jgi:flagellin
MTTIGSYLSRLEYTEANIVTSNESTQASESTIRDADMAKVMTEYTKSNILSQASQSMLAQANQTSASVLSLLQ